MPCLELPDVPAPTLPAPLSITPPAIPDIPGLPNLCCKLPPFDIPIPPIEIPPLILNPAVLATLAAAIDEVLAYVNSLALPCPIE